MLFRSAGSHRDHHPEECVLVITLADPSVVDEATQGGAAGELYMKAKCPFISTIPDMYTNPPQREERRRRPSNRYLHRLRASRAPVPPGKPMPQRLRVLVGRDKWKQPMADKTTRPSAVWLEDHFVCLVLEVNNGPGLGRDQSLRCLVDYCKVITQNEVFFAIAPHPTTSISSCSAPSISSSLIYPLSCWPPPGTV